MHQEPDFSLVHAQRGFTLIEMIVSIVISGVIVSMVALFGRAQLNAYLGATDRAQLSDEADTALRRVARDLQRALPNSVRQTGAFLEFVPISDAGRYRADVDGITGAGDILDFNGTSDTAFDVLGPTVTIVSGQQLVVFNLGIPGADVYAGSNRRAVATGSNLSHITFTANGTWYPSPQNRFHIVGQPVTYECSGASIIRHAGYGFLTSQPTSFSSSPSDSILVGDVDCAHTSFTYAPGVLQRNGLVVLKLTLTRNSESVTLLHQVEILNTP